MNCLIVDDNRIARTELKGMIELDRSLILVGECSDAFEARKELLNNKIDVLFLDIGMPRMNGMELAESLKGNQPAIIFTTSMPEHAVDAFKLNVVDFLVKPICASRFLKAVEKARGLIKLVGQTEHSKNDEFIFVRDSNILKRLDINDILYLEAKGDHVKFYLSDKIYSIHSTLTSIEQKLSPDIFFRVHRSFIVNINKINTIEGGTLIIDRYMIPVSNRFRAALFKRLQIS
nr:LytTR family DNA-binding domain-containing protein [Pedobacter kyonggii]